MGRYTPDYSTQKNCLSSKFIQEQWKRLCMENTNKLTTSDNTKDRYALPLVCEHSRVKIQPECRYINANYVLNKKYIAAQAPLPHTFSQFYDMVWQENVSVLVMLTKLDESGRCKADRYWPTSCHPKIYVRDEDYCQERKWKIELDEKDAYDDDILIRRLIITKLDTGESKLVTQLHYIGWPDHGCPSEISAVCALLSAIEQEYSTGPLLVHCSAGIGRTGTFITIRHELEKAIRLFRSKYASYLNYLSIEDKIAAIQHFIGNHSFAIIDTILEIRQDRKMMVQKQEQFQFCFDFFEYLADSSNQNQQFMEEYILPLFFPHQTYVENNKPLFSFP